MTARQQLCRGLVDRFRKATPGPEHAEVLVDLKERVRLLGALVANKAEMEYLGSFASGFSTNGSDADFSFTWRNYCMYHQGLERVEDQNKRRLVRFSKEASNGGMSDVTYISARIPVVSFTDAATGIQCDVTIGNVGGVQNSQILKRIHDLHPVIPLYIYLVKDWAKAKEVIAPEKSCFNSFTVTTMAVMVLQELGVLPVFSTQTGPCGELTLADVEKTLSTWQLPQAYRELDCKDEFRFGEAGLYLLSAFAQYYSAFDWTKGTVSLCFPRRIRPLYKEVATHYLRNLAELKREKWQAYLKEHKMGQIDEIDFKESLRGEMIQRPDDSPFVVEDFVNYVNCGRRATRARQAPLVSEFQNLRTAIATPDLTVDQLMERTKKFQNTHTDAVAQSRVKRF